jgi:hypothetical protein
MTNRDLCYKKLAVALKNQSICEKMHYIQIKEICINRTEGYANPEKIN